MGKELKTKKGSPTKPNQPRRGKDAPFPLRSPNNDPPELYYKTIKFKTIYRGNSGPKKPIQKVINSSEELVSALGMAFPIVDFSREEAIVVALGENPTTGLSVEIKSATYFTDRGKGLPDLLFVTYFIQKGTQNSHVISCPAHVITLEKLKGDVEFSAQNP
jgi:hypothetical protein